MEGRGRGGPGFRRPPPPGSDRGPEGREPRPQDPLIHGPRDPLIQEDLLTPEDRRTHGPQGPPDPRGRRGGGGPQAAPVVVNGEQVGTVGVPPSPPTWVVVEEYGGTLTWVGMALLVSGTIIASLVIFRPTHNRLRSLEMAARALGEGRTDVRASEAGGDEVTALAHEFNRMADDLQQRAAALSASDKARRQLLADVSHELMTPLTAIRGYMETLSMPQIPLDADTRRRYLEVVNQETYKLEAIIGDLLDVARLEGGGETFHHRPVSVEELFRPDPRPASSIDPAEADRRHDGRCAGSGRGHWRSRPSRTGAPESRVERYPSHPAGGLA